MQILLKKLVVPSFKSELPAVKEPIRNHYGKIKMQASNSILNPLSPWHVPGSHTTCFSPAPTVCYNLSFLPTAVKQGLKMETSSCPSGACSKMSEMLLTGFITR